MKRSSGVTHYKTYFKNDYKTINTRIEIKTNNKDEKDKFQHISKLFFGNKYNGKMSKITINLDTYYVNTMKYKTFEYTSTKRKWVKYGEYDKIDT